MKFLTTQLTYFLSDRTVRQNTRALLQYTALLLFVMIVFSVLFHVLMVYEGQQHSWLTGFYWTLTVMSTLGFGDITFTTDLGRMFSLIVLVTGILMLLIMLPFAFIRFFYAPWLEAQIQLKAPRRVPEGTSDHVILCSYDPVVEALIKRLRDEEIEYFVLASDLTATADLRARGIPAVAGDLDNPETYRALMADRARLIVANREDTMNTNIIITVREVAPDTPILAIASSDDAVDVMELSGATTVVPLKRRLGEQLANRVSASQAHTHIVGEYEGLKIAELPVRNTPLANKSIRETRLRETTGINIIAVWERGIAHPAAPQHMLTDHSVPVLAGTQEQLDLLDDILLIYDINQNPVIIIGGGTVGLAVAASLREKEIPLHIIERNPQAADRARAKGYRVFDGDAEGMDVMMEAGIEETPTVVLTTHDDAMNIYLAAYCRRLNPALRIVSRVTLERNVESIFRAGADFVLSHASLGATTVYATLSQHPPLVLGESLAMFDEPVPTPLVGRRLAESDIGAMTGLIVIGVRRNGRIDTAITGDTILETGMQLVMLGAPDQRHRYVERYH